MTDTRRTEASASPNHSRRKALHAYLSDEAHETWHTVAADHGVSVSALLEAFAGELPAQGAEAGDLETTVRRARRVDAERRRR